MYRDREDSMSSKLGARMALFKESGNVMEFMLQKLQAAREKLNHIPYILSGQKQMVVWSDIREVLFMSCINPKCTVVLNALKHQLNYPASETYMHACTQTEQLQFLRQFIIVSPGTLLVDVNCLKNSEILMKLHDMVSVKHRKSKEINTQHCNNLVKSRQWGRICDCSTAKRPKVGAKEVLLPAIIRTSIEDLCNKNVPLSLFSTRVHSQEEISKALMPLTLLKEAFPGCHSCLEEVAHAYVRSCSSDLSSATQCFPEEGQKLSTFLAVHKGYDKPWFMITSLSLMMSWEEFWKCCHRLDAKKPVLGTDLSICILNVQCGKMESYDPFCEKTYNGWPLKAQTCLPGIFGPKAFQMAPGLQLSQDLVHITLKAVIGDTKINPSLAKKRERSKQASDDHSQAKTTVEMDLMTTLIGAGGINLAENNSSHTKESTSKFKSRIDTDTTASDGKTRKRQQTKSEIKKSIPNKSVQIESSGRDMVNNNLMTAYSKVMKRGQTKQENQHSKLEIKGGINVDNRNDLQMKKLNKNLKLLKANSSTCNIMNVTRDKEDSKSIFPMRHSGIPNEKTKTLENCNPDTDTVRAVTNIKTREKLGLSKSATNSSEYQIRARDLPKVSSETVLKKMNKKRKPRKPVLKPQADIESVSNDAQSHLMKLSIYPSGDRKTPAVNANKHKSTMFGCNSFHNDLSITLKENHFYLTDKNNNGSSKNIISTGNNVTHNDSEKDRTDNREKESLNSSKEKYVQLPSVEETYPEEVGTKSNKCLEEPLLREFRTSNILASKNNEMLNNANDYLYAKTVKPALDQVESTSHYLNLSPSQVTCSQIFSIAKTSEAELSSYNNHVIFPCRRVLTQVGQRGIVPASCYSVARPYQLLTPAYNSPVSPANSSSLSRLPSQKEHEIQAKKDVDRKLKNKNPGEMKEKGQTCLDYYSSNNETVKGDIVAEVMERPELRNTEALEKWNLINRSKFPKPVEVKGVVGQSHIGESEYVQKLNNAESIKPPSKVRKWRPVFKACMLAKVNEVKDKYGNVYKEVKEPPKTEWKSNSDISYYQNSENTVRGNKTSDRRLKLNQNLKSINYSVIPYDSLQSCLSFTVPRHVSPADSDTQDIQSPGYGPSSSSFPDIYDMYARQQKSRAKNADSFSPPKRPQAILDIQKVKIDTNCQSVCSDEWKMPLDTYSCLQDKLERSYVEKCTNGSFYDSDTDEDEVTYNHKNTDGSIPSVYMDEERICNQENISGSTGNAFMDEDEEGICVPKYVDNNAVTDENVDEAMIFGQNIQKYTNECLSNAGPEVENMCISNPQKFIYESSDNQNTLNQFSTSCDKLFSDLMILMKNETKIKQSKDRVSKLNSSCSQCFLCHTSNLSAMDQDELLDQLVYHMLERMNELNISEDEESAQADPETPNILMNESGYETVLTGSAAEKIGRNLTGVTAEKIRTAAVKMSLLDKLCSFGENALLSGQKKASKNQNVNSVEEALAGMNLVDTTDTAVIQDYTETEEDFQLKAQDFFVPINRPLYYRTSKEGPFIHLTENSSIPANAKVYYCESAKKSKVPFGNNQIFESNDSKNYQETQMILENSGSFRKGPVKFDISENIGNEECFSSRKCATKPLKLLLEEELENGSVSAKAFTKSMKPGSEVHLNKFFPSSLRHFLAEFKRHNAKLLTKLSDNERAHVTNQEIGSSFNAQYSSQEDQMSDCSERYSASKTSSSSKCRKIRYLKTLEDNSNRNDVLNNNLSDSFTLARQRNAPILKARQKVSSEEKYVRKLRNRTVQSAKTAAEISASQSIERGRRFEERQKRKLNNDVLGSFPSVAESTFEVLQQKGIVSSKSQSRQNKLRKHVQSKLQKKIQAKWSRKVRSAPAEGKGSPNLDCLHETKQSDTNATKQSDTNATTQRQRNKQPARIRADKQNSSKETHCNRTTKDIHIDVFNDHVLYDMNKVTECKDGDDLCGIRERRRKSLTQNLQNYIRNFSSDENNETEEETNIVLSGNTYVDPNWNNNTLVASNTVDHEFTDTGKMTGLDNTGNGIQTNGKTVPSNNLKDADRSGIEIEIDVDEVVEWDPPGNETTSSIDEITYIITHSDGTQLIVSNQHPDFDNIVKFIEEQKRNCGEDSITVEAELNVNPREEYDGAVDDFNVVLPLSESSTQIWNENLGSAFSDNNIRTHQLASIESNRNVNPKQMQPEMREQNTEKGSKLFPLALRGLVTDISGEYPESGINTANEYSQLAMKVPVNDTNKEQLQADFTEPGTDIGYDFSHAGPNSEKVPSATGMNINGNGKINFIKSSLQLDYPRYELESYSICNTFRDLISRELITQYFTEEDYEDISDFRGKSLLTGKACKHHDNIFEAFTPNISAAEMPNSADYPRNIERMESVTNQKDETDTCYTKSFTPEKFIEQHLSEKDPSCSLSGNTSIDQDKSTRNDDSLVKTESLVRDKHQGIEPLPNNTEMPQSLTDDAKTTSGIFKDTALGQNLPDKFMNSALAVNQIRNGENCMKSTKQRRDVNKSLTVLDTAEDYNTLNVSDCCNDSSMVLVEENDTVTRYSNNSIEIAKTLNDKLEIRGKIAEQICGNKNVQHLQAAVNGILKQGCGTVSNISPEKSPEPEFSEPMTDFNIKREETEIKHGGHEPSILLNAAEQETEYSADKIQYPNTDNTELMKVMEAYAQFRKEDENGRIEKIPLDDSFSAFEETLFDQEGMFLDVKDDTSNEELHTALDNIEEGLRGNLKLRKETKSRNTSQILSKDKVKNSNKGRKYSSKANKDAEKKQAFNLESVDPRAKLRGRRKSAKPLDGEDSYDEEEEQRREKEEQIAAEGFIKTQQKYMEIILNKSLEVQRGRGVTPDPDNIIPCAHDSTASEYVRESLPEGVPVHGERQCYRLKDETAQTASTDSEDDDDEQEVWIEDVSTNCRYQLIDDEEGMNLGGLAFYKDYVFPYVYINGYKFTPLKDALQCFGHCQPSCAIPRSVLNQNKTLIKSLSTWDQVYKLELIVMKKGYSLKTGDTLVKLDNFLSLLPELTKEVVKRHKNTTLKKSKNCSVKLYCV